jgi:putative membrane protein
MEEPMTSTGLLALVCAGGLTVACASDARNGLDDSNNSSGAVGTSGQGPSAESTSKESTVSHGSDSDARNFALQTSKRGAAEVELGKLAVARTQNRSVKRFAQMMVLDHTNGGNELEQAVVLLGGTVSAELPDQSEELLDKLKTLRGAEFDRTYMAAMVDAHQEMRGLVSGRLNDAKRMTGSKSALETAVDQWAENVLPKVERHLAMAQELSDSLTHTANDTH